MDENKVQFVDESEDAEDKALKNLMIEKLLKLLKELDSDEWGIIDAIYHKGKSEREFSAETGIPQKTVNYRKRKVLAKLRKLLES